MLRLKELREERELSQEEVAKGINTSQRNIGRWEKGENEPSADFIVRLADYFQVSADYLLGRTDDLGVIQKDFGGNRITERKLLKYYRGVGEDKQNAILHVAESFYRLKKQ